jgi:hypothetical protein
MQQGLFEKLEQALYMCAMYKKKKPTEEEIILILGRRAKIKRNRNRVETKGRRRRYL